MISEGRLFQPGRILEMNRIHHTFKNIPHAKPSFAPSHLLYVEQLNLVLAVGPKATTGIFKNKAQMEIHDLNTKQWKPLLNQQEDPSEEGMLPMGANAAFVTQDYVYIYFVMGFHECFRRLPIYGLTNPQIPWEIIEDTAALQMPRGRVTTRYDSIACTIGEERVALMGGNVSHGKWPTRTDMDVLDFTEWTSEASAVCHH